MDLVADLLLRLGQFTSPKGHRSEGSQGWLGLGLGLAHAVIA